MATATKQSHAARHLASPPLDARAPAPAPAATEFLIVEDNGGSYHWTIVARDGATLARSERFGSHEDAEQAAQRVRDAAASARFERRTSGATPVDLIAWRDAQSDAADAERWLDEGGSFSSEGVTR